MFSTFRLMSNLNRMFYQYRILSIIHHVLLIVCFRLCWVRLKSDESGSMIDLSLFQYNNSLSAHDLLLALIDGKYLDAFHDESLNI